MTSFFHRLRKRIVGQTRLEKKVERLEKRLLSYYTNRWNAIDCAANYLVTAQLDGDYAEFGTFKGTTFGYAADLFGRLFEPMRFLAFDSFEGLPDPEGIDKGPDGYTSGFYKGQFEATEKEFLKNVKTAAPNLKMDRVVTVKGWFDESLTRETARNLSLEKLACVWIDCDYYESTVPILDFILPHLSVGSVILFDDWRSYRNLADHGEQRACAEWLNKNPGFVLNELISFGYHGQAFTVASLPEG